MELSEEQISKLWGETGPYSQVNLIIQTRILDDRVSRVFLVVEAEINPLTYELVKKHKNRFQDDIKIMQLLENAEYRALAFGYVACAFEAEYKDETVMREAQRCLVYTKETIIKMHKFVMDLINNEEVGQTKRLRT